MTLFKAILTSGSVEDAVQSMLQTWMQTYLAEMERQTDRPARALPMVRSWQEFSVFDSFDANQIPAVVVVSDGTRGTPVKHGDGTYTASWPVSINIIVSARDVVSTRDLAGVYAAAVRAAILQHRSLGGFARATAWEGETFSAIPTVAGRSILVATVNFVVEVDEVVTEFAGPRTVPADPYSAPPEGQTAILADVTIVKVNSIP